MEPIGKGNLNVYQFINMPSQHGCQVQDWFGNLRSDYITQNEPNISIDEQIATVKQRNEQIVNEMSQKPSMGLESPEVIQAENDLQCAEGTQNTASVSVNEQEGVCNDAQQDVDNNQNIVNNAQSSVNTSQSNVNASQTAVENDQSAVETATTEVDTATDNVESAQSTVTETSNSVTTAQSSLESAQAALTQAQDTATQSQTSSSTENDTSSETTTSNDTAIQQAQAQVEQAQQELEQAQQENEEAEQNLETEQNTLTEAQGTLTDAQGTLETSQTTLQENQAELQTNQESLSTAQNELQTSQNTLDTENSTLATQQTELDSATEEVANAEQQVDEEEENFDDTQNEIEEVVKDEVSEGAETLIDDIREKRNKAEEETTDLKQMVNGETEYSKKLYNQAVEKINSENVTALDCYTVGEIARNEGRSEKQKEKDLEHIYQAYITRANEVGVTEQELSRIQENFGESFVVGDYYQTSELASQLDNAINSQEFENWKQEECSRIIALRDDPNDTRTALQKAAEEKFVEMGGNTIDKLEWNNYIELGSHYEAFNAMDGHIDVADATQQTGNCWLMAGINSMASTEQGAEILDDSIYWDKLHHTAAVHLQEAEDRGFHDGIYAYTEDDAYSINFSSGDGDTAILNDAVNKYFNEIDENPTKSSINNIDGNYNYRFYEVITGSQSTRYSLNESIPEGVGHASLIDLKEDTLDKNKEIFDKLYKFVENGEGTAILSSDFIGSDGRNGSHAYSVVGVENGRLILQESNNDSYNAGTFDINDDSNTGCEMDDQGTWNIFINENNIHYFDILSTLRY